MIYSVLCWRGSSAPRRQDVSLRLQLLAWPTCCGESNIAKLFCHNKKYNQSRDCPVPVAAA
jgi:hypothetical protein